MRDPAELDRLGEAVVAARRPVLGICAGMQLQARFAGGTIGPHGSSEHGFLPIRIHDGADLLRGLQSEVVVFQDHDHEITVLPPGFRALASSPACAIQAIADPARRWWGTQFHPEEFRPEHPAGEQVLRSFFDARLLEIARSKQRDDALDIGREGPILVDGRHDLGQLARPPAARRGAASASPRRCAAWRSATSS